MSTSDARYSLGRRERRGSVLGWRPGQALAVAAGGITLVAGVGTDRMIGVAFGAMGAVAGLVVATVPVRGRGLDEWVPVLATYWLRPRRGSLWLGASIAEDAGGLAHVRWPNGTATVVVELHHRGLRALSDEPAGLAEAIASWLRGVGQGAMRDWTVTLLCETAPGRIPSDALWSDRGCRVREYVAVTAADPVDLVRSLGDASIAGAVPLDLCALGSLLERRVAPAIGTIFDCEFVARWSWLEGPASMHASFSVEGWPTGLVDEQLLAPLCVARDRRTVVICATVEETRRAREHAARLRTSSAADRALTRSAGFLASAEADRDDTRDAERAAELAAGHESVRVIAMVAIDACDAVELEGAAARLVADATTCGIRLRRCDGDHRRAILASIPGWCAP